MERPKRPANFWQDGKWLKGEPVPGTEMFQYLDALETYIDHLLSQRSEAVEVLEEQRCGAEWQRKNESTWNGADDEALERLTKALTALKEAAP